MESKIVVREHWSGVGWVAQVCSDLVTHEWAEGRTAEEARGRLEEKLRARRDTPPPDPTTR